MKSKYVATAEAATKCAWHKTGFYATLLYGTVSEKWGKRFSVLSTEKPGAPPRHRRAQSESLFAAQQT